METPPNTYLPLLGLTFSDNRDSLGGNACLPHKQEPPRHLWAPGHSSREWDQVNSADHLPTV